MRLSNGRSSRNYVVHNQDSLAFHAGTDKLAPFSVILGFFPVVSKTHIDTKVIKQGSANDRAKRNALVRGAKHDIKVYRTIGSAGKKARAKTNVN
jgi:hypothetical protein